MLYGYKQHYNLYKNIYIYSFTQTLQNVLKARFDTSNYELDRPLSKGINKKVIGLLKNELCGKVMTEVKMYSYLTDGRDENDKEKGTKMCVIINCFNDSV